MAYIHYIALILVLPIFYAIPNTIISIMIGLLEYPFKRKGLLFFLGRLLRGYLYASILIQMSTHFVTQGMSKIILLAFSIFGIFYFLKVETESANINLTKNIEFKLAVDLKYIILLLYSIIFLVFNFLKFPIEPFFSGLILKLIVKLYSYKIFILFFTLLGIGSFIIPLIGLISILSSKNNEDYNWSKFFKIFLHLPIKLISETYYVLINKKSTFLIKLKYSLLLIPLLVFSPFIVFIGFLIMRKEPVSYNE